MAAMRDTWHPLILLKRTAITICHCSLQFKNGDKNPKIIEL